MKRNNTKKAIRKTVTIQKNDKTRKGFRTDIKAGMKLPVQSQPVIS